MQTVIKISELSETHLVKWDYLINFEGVYMPVSSEGESYERVRLISINGATRNPNVVLYCHGCGTIQAAEGWEKYFFRRVNERPVIEFVKLGNP